MRGDGLYLRVAMVIRSDELLHHRMFHIVHGRLVLDLAAWLGGRLRPTKHGLRLVPSVVCRLLVGGHVPCRKIYGHELGSRRDHEVLAENVLGASEDLQHEPMEDETHLREPLTTFHITLTCTP
jgi:hypothetical protein